MAPGVKKAQGELLQVGEQVPPDVEQHPLGGPHHNLGVAVGAGRPHSVNGGGRRYAGSQGGGSALLQAVYHRADHICAQQVGQSADGHQKGHRQQQEFVPPHVGKEGAHGVPQILRLFRTELPRRHRTHPLSSGKHKFPGKWGLTPEAPGGCPLREPCRRPAQ